MFFQRHGGVSRTPYDSLNVSVNVGDRGDHVGENRQRIKKVLGIPSLLSLGQVHGDQVLSATRLLPEDREVPGYDAIVSNTTQALMIQQADCQAVTLFDPFMKVAAVAHVGWKGSVNGILGKTIDVMTREFSCQPADIIGVISPSLGACCAEFRGYRTTLPSWMHRFKGNNDYFDFPAISRFQLAECGLSPVNIHRIEICTRCDSNYFSFRRDQDTGRFATVVAIQD